GRLEEAAVPQADEKNLGAKPTAMKPFRSAWRSGSLLSLVSLSLTSQLSLKVVAVLRCTTKEWTRLQ
ncbi:MAG: hypothetical protein ACREJU_01300, partial [Nitrospiraceae bacterium]